MAWNLCAISQHFLLFVNKHFVRVVFATVKIWTAIQMHEDKKGMERNESTEESEKDEWNGGREEIKLNVQIASERERESVYVKPIFACE